MIKTVWRFALVLVASMFDGGHNLPWRSGAPGRGNRNERIRSLVKAGVVPAGAQDGGTEIDDYMSELKEVVTLVKERTPDPEEFQRMTTAISKMQAEVNDLRLDKALKKADDGKMRVREGRLAGYTAFDLSIMEKVIADRERAGVDARWHGPVKTAIVDSRSKLRQRYSSDDAAMAWEDHALKAAGSTVGGNVKALQRFRNNVAQWRGIVHGEVTKAMDSTTATTGDELVPTFESAELWMDVNLATNILPTLNQVPMPTNPYDIPLQFGDANWYPITENVEALTTNKTTAKNTLTAQGIKAGVAFSDELDEDSIVPFIPNLRSNLVRNAAEVIDDVLLNADTTVTNNINADGATINATSAGKAQWLLGWDGLRHLPLVDNTSQGVDFANAVPTAIGVYNRALRLLGKYAAFQVRGDVVFFGGVAEIIHSLSMDEVETLDKLGVRATISSGELGSVYGIPLIMTEQMRSSDGDGKVTDAGNATEGGSILALNTTQWNVGFRRAISLETQREAGKGQTTLWASMRIALTARGTRTTATHTSLIYDIDTV